MPGFLLACAALGLADWLALALRSGAMIWAGVWRLRFMTVRSGFKAVPGSHGIWISFRGQAACACGPQRGGLNLRSRRVRAACKDYVLSQEFVTPCAPEQNGMIERFFRSLKEECVWLQNFECFEQAKAAVAEWIRFCNTERLHQSLHYLSPEQFRAQQVKQVA